MHTEVETSLIQPSAVHGTFVIERSFPKPPQAVFTAFSTADRLRRWLAEGENQTVDRFELDFRVGGKELVSFHYPEAAKFQGVVFTHLGTFLDIVPDSRIVTASTMALGEKRISASLVTFELLQTAKGTDLICTHQGAFFEGSDGVKFREAGWNKLLDRLSGEISR